jgi:Rrf2 family transcriptional regulator, iron-sulfur cluster assembly transcription factor
MMCLSRTTGYAIQALGCMDKLACETHQIAAIAKCAKVPRPYLAKIIGALSRRGLVLAKRGFRGGIALARPARDITLLEIVEAVEGNNWLGQCLLGFEDCAHHAYCPTQDFWQRMRRELIAKLDQVSLAEVLDAKTSKAKKQMPARRPVYVPLTGWPAPTVIPMQG